jgi:chemotaxis protein MotB
MKQKSSIWMTIYADMITTLMFFFLAAWALSRVDRDTQTQVSEAFRVRATGERYSDVRKDLAKDIKNGYANEYSKIEITEKRIKITLSEQVFFESGSSALSGHVRENLHSLSALLKKTNTTIVVEGYTDDIPLKNGSNWELSLARAISVVDYFVQYEQIPRSRFMVAGYGEYKPLAPNSSDENRKKNRRIEITVLRYE